MPPPKARWHPADVVVLVVAALLALVLAKIGVVRHLTLSPQSQDLGAISHFIANPLDAGFGGSIHGDLPFFHGHLNLTAIALHPLSYVLDAAILMVLAVALSAAAAGWVLHREAAARTGEPWLGCALALGWLFDPTVHLAGLFDPTPEPTATLLLLLAWRAYRLERPRAWALWLALAALTKENVPLVVLGLTIVPLLDRRSRAWWLIPAGIGVASFALVPLRQLVVPYHGSYNASIIFYGHLGPTLPAVGLAVLSQPFESARQIVSKLPPVWLWLPALLAPLFRPRWLIPLVPLLATRGLMAPWNHSEWWLFHGAAVPVVLAHIALVEVVAGRRKARARRVLSVGSAAIALALWGFMIAPRELRALVTEWPTSVDARRRALLARTPQEGRILASVSCLAMLADRPGLRLTFEMLAGRHVTTGPYLLPSPPATDVEAIALDADGDASLLRHDRAARARARELASRLVVADQVEDLLLLVRGEGDRRAVRRAPRPARDGPPPSGLALEALLPGESIERGERLEVTLAWRRGPAAPAQADVHLTLRDASGATVRRMTRPLAWGLAAPADAPRWDEAEALLEDATLFVPRELAPGPYALEVQAVDPTSRTTLARATWRVAVR